MNILIMHDALEADAPPEAADNLIQLNEVSAALRQLGHRVDHFAVDGDLRALRTKIKALNDTLVFNLVEAIQGSDAACAVIPAMLDAAGIYYTGSGSAAMALAGDKPEAKRLLRERGLPTAVWCLHSGMPADQQFVSGRYIVKTCYEHASIGIDDSSVAQHSSAASLCREIASRSAALKKPCFAEQFIEGREFNVGVIASASGLRVLPIAEIDFSAFPAGKPRMVGYSAKWTEDSFEFNATPRRFNNAEPGLIASLTQLALEACKVFSVKGYARVDFRVDEHGPQILEVNINPCLSPDAGFAAALANEGTSFKQAVQNIVTAATGH